EPAYVELHAEVRDELWKIMWEVEDLAKQHFSFAIPANKVDERFSKMCTEYMTPELQLIVDCVAVGGPNAEEGWKELFVDPELRQALVCGIVGNVIVEQVFKTLVFGANDVQKKVVHEIHEKTKNEDSFDRTRAYANAIKQFLPASTLPTLFSTHIQTLTLRLYTLLLPLLTLSHGTPPSIPKRPSPTHTTLSQQTLDTTISSLFSLLTRAACLSIALRLDSSSVYHFPQTPKDGCYASSNMECFNNTTMACTNPKSRAWPAAVPPAERQRALDDAPLIRITCMDACHVYRRGGWEGEESDPGWKELGIRSRQLTQAWVACRWGRSRCWERGQKADRREVHGEKWAEPGFVEFRDVVEGEKRR
ncbi:hypothetical protein K432DRAFT_250567, partial [Lepidopterella palustris CBS 459.81]